MRYRTIVALVPVLWLGACTTSPPVTNGKADTHLVQTATQPLNDLNLLRSEIPAVLQAARKAPYATPADRSCSTLDKELLELHAALGPDIDAPASTSAEGEPAPLTRAVTAVGDVTLGAVEGAVQTAVDGVVPFRSWVRRLSGAERHSSEVVSAITAGVARRSYLKGWQGALGCAAGTTGSSPAR